MYTENVNKLLGIIESLADLEKPAFIAELVSMLYLPIDELEKRISEQEWEDLCNEINSMSDEEFLEEYYDSVDPDWFEEELHDRRTARFERYD